MNDRSDLIVQCFSYLIDEYGFKIERKEFDSSMMGNAIVIFKSTKIGIEIVIDRDQALLSIGDQSDPRKYWFEFGDVVQFLAPFIDNVYDFPEEKPETTTWDDVVESQLNRLAAILRQYCEPLLAGEPLMKTEIKKVEEKRVAEMFKRLGH
ncbi:MAG: hypothetical protein ACOYYF_03545 [Chloroflexota bacterium]|nr:hypothetical protein [Chloroflexota bacterium]MBI5703749.1 hypothetical protein [Chloroflexota bacterium]